MTDNLLDFRAHPVSATIRDLWIQLDEFAGNRVADNMVRQDYPLDVREAQMHTLDTIVAAIHEAHAAMRKEGY